MKKLTQYIWCTIAIPALLISSPRTIADSSATASSPIGLTSDDRFVWVVNPDNNSVSALEVGNDVNRKISEIPVGEEPQCLAVTGDNRKVYVTNRRSGTVSVIDAESLQVIKTIKVGTEPFGCALTPDGRRLYVANFSSDDVSVINTHGDVVIKTIDDVGPRPAAVAITENKVYVTLLLARLRQDNRSIAEKEGRDDGKEGRVIVLSTRTDKIIGSVTLNPLADAGFKSNGSVLDRIGATDPATFTFATAAFPNLLQSIVINGDRAYLPNVGFFPERPGPLQRERASVALCLRHDYRRGFGPDDQHEQGHSVRASRAAAVRDDSNCHRFQTQRG